MQAARVGLVGGMRRLRGLGVVRQEGVVRRVRRVGLVRVRAARAIKTGETSGTCRTSETGGTSGTCRTSGTGGTIRLIIKQKSI